ncbi:hypothetical protein NL676_022277 [Syzygium grande]|nr:hypothetical protein NL676_022277 [Syzygium grande]
MGLPRIHGNKIASLKAHDRKTQGRRRGEPEKGASRLSPFTAATPLSFTFCNNDRAAARRCRFMSPPVPLGVTGLAESRSSSPASNFADYSVDEVTGLSLHLPPPMTHTTAVPQSRHSGVIAAASQIVPVSSTLPRSSAGSSCRRSAIFQRILTFKLGIQQRFNSRGSFRLAPLETCRHCSLFNL